ncbi:non-canonical purine NTP pyrophosphatase [Rhodopirellula bahusiensis]|uniref:non-canonical purine NTP pyrophosphatase n=1 Tax=Rhodopirellula bahusiensis TaxID=2014065 RepID=UPI0032634222
MKKRKINYVTSSRFKQEEIKVFLEDETMADGTKVADVFEFVLRSEEIKEILEVDLVVMVQAEVINAYSRIKVPCIVEHAGLVFDDFDNESYPGGLTKPMWNTLRNNFLEETNSAGRMATARAVIAYCDGKSVQTFVGETKGRLASSPRGDRQFYWDTVFIPDDPSGAVSGKTYAEIVSDPSLGLKYKLKHFSQSAKAMRKFLEHVARTGAPEMWGDL